MLEEIKEKNQDKSGEMVTEEVNMDGVTGSADIENKGLQEAIRNLKKEDKIVCIGDSITYGYEVEGFQTWIGRLRKEKGMNLLNVGINGDTTSGMLSRFHVHVVQQEPKAVIIMGGANDIIAETGMEYITNNLAMMTQHALDKSIIPIIGIEPEPVHKEVPDEWKIYTDYNQVMENIAALREWILLFCQSNSLPCIDFDLGMKKKLRAGYNRYFMDGVHPNSAGHSIMAQIAEEFFQDLGVLQKEDKFSL